MNGLAKMLRTVGDESRLKILCVIFGDRKVCVSEIAARLGMSVAIVSHHLRVLAGEGLLEPVREGKRICYAVSENAFTRDLRRFICKYK